ncbi:MAG: cyclic nucleotide-binding domain-containing protein [Flavobacteriales bacterium]|nr:cyclic nucleotide-binding domain-containing protein [Flavobacteriales bacterium]
MFPPFDRMSEEERLYLATRTEVTYVRPGQVVFEKGMKPGDHFFMVRSGAVDLKDGEELIDVFDEGDLFGIRPLLANDTFRASATVLEEGIVYYIPLVSGKGYWSKTPGLRCTLPRISHRPERDQVNRAWVRSRLPMSERTCYGDV